MPDRTAQQMTDRLNSLIEEIQTFQKDNTHGEKFCDVVLVAHGHLLQAMWRDGCNIQWSFRCGWCSNLEESGRSGKSFCATVKVQIVLTHYSYQHHNIKEPVALVGIGFPHQEGR
jgi:broad specificity phosphatase PhoE